MIRQLLAGPATPRGRLLADLWCDAVAIAFIVAAFLVARHDIDGLRGVYDPDLFRDIAQAQTVRDGHWLTDQYYAGEWAWYNPLIAWIVAAGSWLSGVTVETLHLRSGPFLNLLGPIGFYLLGVRLAGRRAALTALVIYLFFITGNEHSWASSTYSPWLFADNFSSGLFFWCALIFLWAQQRLTFPRAIVFGISLGVLFLAHAAPAVILALVAAALWWREWRQLMVAGVAALAVASPFLGPLVLHYHLRIRHATPLAYNYPHVGTEGFVQTLRMHRWYLASAIAGLWFARKQPMLIAWLVIAIALTFYSIWPWRPIVPAFHFWVYTLAAVALLAGWALSRIAPNPYVLTVATTTLVVWNWHAYVTRNDLQLERWFALQRKDEHIEAAALLRRLTQPDDVIVGGNGAVRLIIGPAGRKTVAPEEYFANPYVEYTPRQQARVRMMKALEAGDLPAFNALAPTYRVSGFVLVGQSECVTAAEKHPLLWTVRPDLCVGLTDATR